MVKLFRWARTGPLKKESQISRHAVRNPNADVSHKAEVGFSGKKLAHIHKPAHSGINTIPVGSTTHRCFVVRLFRWNDTSSLEESNHKLYNAHHRTQRQRHQSKPVIFNKSTQPLFRASKNQHRILILSKGLKLNTKSKTNC